MRLRIVLALVVVVALASALQRRRQDSAAFEKAPIAKTDAEKKVLAVLEEAKQSGNVHLEVPPTDGRMLRLMAEALDAKHVVEVGTSTGYSGMWISLALLKTGGRLTTFELDPGRAAQARKHFQQAGVERMITIVQGNAHETINQVRGPVDMVFIDADKDGYVDYLNKLLPLVRPGGIIAAHNVEMAAAYVNAVTSNPDLETLFYMPGAGLSLTLKKR